MSLAERRAKVGLRRVHAAMLLSVLLVAGGCRKSAQPVTVSATADFGNLKHYAAANSGVGPRVAGRPRVVFLGDSILDYWGKAAGHWFASPEWLDRGISGQTTSQILLRAQDDAMALRPDAMLVEGGSNDIRYGFSDEAIRDNMAAIGAMAEGNHIRVYVALATPTCDCFRQIMQGRTPERIRRLNEVIRELCKERGWACVDLYTPLADEHGAMRKELTLDGVHPNDAGYAALTPVVMDSFRRYQ